MKRRNIKLKWLLTAGPSIILIAGCSSLGGYYTPATVVDGTISNPKVGWNGYTIKVPDGLTVFSTADQDPESPHLTTEQRELLEYEDMQSRNGGIKFIECFLINDDESRITIIFSNEICETKPWSTLGSEKLNIILNRMIRRKKVLINDTTAMGKTITINGKRGWQLSGTPNADGFFGFKRQGNTAYEGIFIIGSLNEAYWIEGYSSVTERAFLKQQVIEMTESLQF